MSAAIATAIGPAAYGHRRQNRQDLSGLVGCFPDIEAFVDAVLAELAAMEADGTRPTRPGRSRHWRSGAAQGDYGDLVRRVLRPAVAGDRQLCDIPFSTLYTLFARWTRLGLWRRLLDRLRRTWRLAAATLRPSAVVIDSRSCRSAPVASRAASTAARRSGASRSRSRSTSTASRWQSMSRRPTRMIRKGSCLCCASWPGRVPGTSAE